MIMGIVDGESGETAIAERTDSDGSGGEYRRQILRPEGYGTSKTYHRDIKQAT